MREHARVWGRVALVLIAIAGFLIETSLREPLAVLLGWSESRKRRSRSLSLGGWGRFLLGSLNFEVVLEAGVPLSSEGSLLVANHLSFWDTVAIASKLPVVFVTSVEVRDTPVLGWIARGGGCVFVERRDRSRKEAERAQVTEALRDGSLVVLFPEATSTDGSSVLPFKKSFFTPAIESERPVTPLCIRYTEVDGQPVDRHNRDSVFYYGALKFHTQLLRALKLRSLRISLEVLSPIATRQGVTDREQLVTQAYEAVVSRFVPIEG